MLHFVSSPSQKAFPENLIPQTIISQENQIFKERIGNLATKALTKSAEKKQLNPEQTFEESIIVYKKNQVFEVERSNLNIMEEYISCVDGKFYLCKELYPKRLDGDFEFLLEDLEIENFVDFAYNFTITKKNGTIAFYKLIKNFCNSI
jgi:hypothetical protein